MTPPPSWWPPAPDRIRVTARWPGDGQLYTYDLGAEVSSPSYPGSTGTLTVVGDSLRFMNYDPEPAPAKYMVIHVANIEGPGGLPYNEYQYLLGDIVSVEWLPDPNEPWGPEPR